MFPFEPEPHRRTADPGRRRTAKSDHWRTAKSDQGSRSGRVLRGFATAVALSTVLTGCLFSSGSPSPKVADPAPGSTTPGSATMPAITPGATGGAVTVPDTYVPGQPAPTVPLAQAQAVQLEAANSTTTVPSAPNRLAPMTSLLATAAKGLLTAEAASRNLWDSWQDKDRERAVLYASPDAVKSLFALPWRPETVDQGCRPSTRPEMAARCLFVQGNVVKILDVSGSAKDGYKVARVTTARQNTPSLSVLPTTPLDPSISVDPNLAGVSTTTLDPNVLVSIPDAGLPADNPADVGGIPATTPAAPRTSGSGTRRSTTKTTTTRKPATKTTKAPASDAPDPATPPADAPAEAPATQPPPPPGGGVPAGAPVVNEVQ